MSINKFYKLLDLMKTKYYMKFKQKPFKGKKYTINYLLDKNKSSDILLVVFTSCTKKGQKARYNYIRTLENFKVNKLFILDDFGFDGRGAYYLGKDKDFKIQLDVSSLIDSVSNDLNIKKEVFIGSSKGGYAALYFGLNRTNSIIISGAPQYRLGNYLSLPSHEEILQYIMGDTKEYSIDYLNKLLEDKLNSTCNNKNKIYLHYSTEEETFEPEIEPLINKIKELNLDHSFDIHNYKNHSDLTLFFPQYIKDILSKYL